ncbi:Uma2 family endonuclease [Planktothrix mougeotii]|uniref:Uma2 family endonuclease n=1 Tax=Planktothrix mougeotii LEGE 06226 TaxID=1828728 RepID=A0ABR9UAD1_9CYAN|nr:Uma2 family endonuclease [Planktothrix mougeotii]MBE9143377.1 Uma2 family endonuclease [Planktothrix mougeotii LEGE 06226]
MVQAPPALKTIATNTWVKATWEEFLALTENPQYAEGKFYYDQGYVRVEMSPLGSAHSQDNSIISTVIVIYATLKNIRIKELTNPSFRKTGIRDSQPDIGFYIGDNFQFPPRNNSPINLDELTAPNLIVEIGASSFTDDIGRKRLLYEKLGIQEYWVVNVEDNTILAFAVENQGSRLIEESLVLPGLKIALVVEALQRSQTEDDGSITRWLMGAINSP